MALFFYQFTPLYGHNRYRGIKAGQKITDENGNLYEVYGLNTNGRALLNGITQLLVQGKFEGNTVTLL